MAKRGRRGRNEQPGPSGFLVVDKPPDWTSHDVVDAARKWLGTRRVGHLGTLDPSATGVLPLAVRDATKLIPYLGEETKIYRGTIRLGVETDTLDADGEVVARSDAPLPDEAAIRQAMEGLTGEIDQIPPMYSAVKRDGVPLYRLARQGVEVEREPRRVRVARFDLLGREAADLRIEVTCSPGTYVRVLATDLGSLLGCGGHLLALRRIRNGPFVDDQARTVELLEQDAASGGVAKHLVPPADALGLPRAHLTLAEVGRVVHGGDLPGGRHAAGERPGQRFAAMDPDGDLLAVMELRADRRLRPLRVLRAVAAGG